MKPPTILYVEDDSDIRRIAMMAMQTLGNFTVRECNSGLAALAAIADFSPELLLIDVMMPGLTGPETLSCLRAMSATAAIPVIFMTARAEIEEMRTYYSLGAIGVIPKPFDPMTLPQQIMQIWQNHLMERKHA